MLVVVRPSVILSTVRRWLLCRPRLPRHGSASVMPKLWGSSRQSVRESLGTSGLLRGSVEGNWQ